LPAVSDLTGDGRSHSGSDDIAIHQGHVHVCEREGRRGTAIIFETKSDRE
jgi:hypothetical protein